MISTPYKSTATFDENSLPAALCRTHNTKDGVWGVLSVLAGTLRYVVEDGSAGPRLVNAGETVLILPRQPHRVELVGGMQMLVEFYDHHPVLQAGDSAAAAGSAQTRRAAYLEKRQLDDDMIVLVVDTFYGRVRQDEMLADIFNEVVGGNWDHHLSTMYDFWSTVMLMSGRYKGNPMQKHARMPELAPEHFQRWLALFETTVFEICSDADARLFMEKAGMIARNFQYALQVMRGDLPARSGKVA